MDRIASWVRQSDETNFQRFFELDPRLKLENARQGAIDLASAAGLILTGGPDISERFLRQKVTDARCIEEADPERDQWEFEALKQILEAGKPVLAICKGAQVLNVALGGTLHLDIPNHRDPEARLHNIQPLRWAGAGSPYFEKVNSSHHQAIDRPGDGLEIEAWAREDGIVEQVRLKNYPYALGVQYHPERDELYAPLFMDFFSHIKNELRRLTAAAGNGPARSHDPGGARDDL